MTHIKQFIEDAIEGGWNHKLKRNGYYSVFLDPQAWQAVGKTRGWGDVAYCYECHSWVPMWGECECDEDEVTPVAVMVWHYKWHRFIDHLADGKSIEEALAAIA